MAELKRQLRRQCSDQWRGSVPFGLDEPINSLQTIITGILTQRTSESCLLVGAPGTGKSLVLDRLFEEAKKSHSDLQIVQLSGLLHHDPRTACEEILYQFEGVEHDLSVHSFDEAAEQVIEQFQHSQKIVFLVLENLDLFASLQQAKQSLLYFLFDLQHQTDICVGIFGVTTRLDCISLMEKRVISRFSQIQIHFYPPDDLIQYLLFVQHRLLIVEDSSMEGEFLQQVQSHNQSIKTLLQQDVTAISLLERNFEFNKNPRQTLELLKLAVLEMDEEQPEFGAKQLFKAYDLLWVDTHQALIEGLSSLEQCLVISFMTFEVNQEDPQYNFERSYENYRLFASATNAPGSRYSKPVALKAFETLLELEIIRPVKRAMDSKIPLEYREVRLTLDPFQVQEIIKQSNLVVSYLKNWAAYLVIHAKN